MKVLGLYMRISKDDEESGDESNSIVNQRQILYGYIKTHKDLQNFACQEYVDDGYSGKNFRRPGISKLLEAVREGKVQGIIVKDFSRFGRNYVEVGEYLERIFPMLPFRVISVNNYFDSALINNMPGMDIPFQNLIYDFYSEENSVKIKQELFRKRSQGKCCVSRVSYGYKKTDGEVNCLVIDEEAAKIVRLIFDQYRKMGSKAEIARYLNEKNIMTPEQYAWEKGRIKHLSNNGKKKVWNGTIVGKILKNPVYMGDTVFHKKEVVETGSSKVKYLSEKEWVICENTHEPIVSRELFEEINHDHVKPTRPKENQKEVNISPLKGKIRCGGCRHFMVRRNRKNPSYYCRYYYELKIEGCCSESIQEKNIMEVVQKVLEKQLEKISEKKELLDFLDEIKLREQKKYEKEMRALEEKVQKNENEDFLLYEKYKNDEISKDKYNFLKEKNLGTREELEIQKKEVMVNQEKMREKYCNLFSLIKGKKGQWLVIEEMAEVMLSHIYIYRDNKIEIIFNCT